MAKSSWSSRHVMNWDMQTIRNFSPLYTLGGKRYDEPFPPVRVEISAQFDDNATALDFEAKVREILEEM